MTQWPIPPEPVLPAAMPHSRPGAAAENTESLILNPGPYAFGYPTVGENISSDRAAGVLDAFPEATNSGLNSSGSTDDTTSAQHGPTDADVLDSRSAVPLPILGHYHAASQAFDSMATLPVVAVSIGQNCSDATGAYQVSHALAPQNAYNTRTLLVFYRSPGKSPEDLCCSNFFHFVIGDSESVIREYSCGGRTLYFAVAGRGDDRRFDAVVLDAPEPSIQALAVKFTDNKVKRAVWGHGRFGRSDIRGLESHFKAIPAWGVWNGHFVSFHWVTPADNTVFLAEHHRFELSLDYAMASNLPDLENLINLFEPYMENAMKNLMVEYTYAVLAALENLSNEQQKFEYLQYQRTYFEGMAFIEFSVPRDANIRICLQSFKPLVEVYQTAMNQIWAFFAIVSESVIRKNRYPTPAQVAEARILGGIMGIWSIGSCRAHKYRQDASSPYLDYHAKITSLRDDLRQKARRLNAPALVPNYMEPQYAIAAYEHRVAGLTSPDW
ncbi:hypothetical protein B0H14DRAFT_2833047 [Mycena olivaceomarginata]|nr:hypothetical protein B0H14DRAFT_2833047 [Mycena olivaceomarginata]